jgi:hypothetical protein
MSHQKRNRRIAHEFVGHPTEQPLTQGQMTISTHNDEVGLAPLGLRHQLGCDFFAAALDAMQRGVDRVMPEMIDGVDAEDGLFFGRVLAGHDHDRNLIREALASPFGDRVQGRILQELRRRQFDKCVRLPKRRTKLLNETRLADARFADNERELGVAGARPLPAPAQQVELLLAPGEGGESACARALPPLARTMR